LTLLGKVNGFFIYMTIRHKSYRRKDNRPGRYPRNNWAPC